MTKQFSLTALLLIATSITSLFLFTSIQADTTSSEAKTVVEAVTGSDSAEATSDSAEPEKKEAGTTGASKETEEASKGSDEPKKKKAAEEDEEPDCE